MIVKEAKGEVHLILEPKIEDFSEIALGLLIRSIPHNLSIAYVDVSGKAIKLNNFFENISLSYSFVKHFRKIHFELFTFKNNNKISKSILPQVEFYSINEQIFSSSLKDFDIVIFDNYSDAVLKKFTLLNITSSKQPHQEFFIITSQKKISEEIKNNVNNYYSIDISKKKTLTSSKECILNVVGDKSYSSLYSIGHMIRNFINKKDVKYIGFDRGDDIYGENAFFSALKKWTKENTLYGTFDFVNTGIKRYFEKGFRNENILEDTKEAKEGLSLLETALRKQSPIIADSIIDAQTNNILEFEDIKKVLGKIKNELVVTGETENSNFSSISTKSVKINVLKRSKSKLLRSGLDY